MCIKRSLWQPALQFCSSIIDIDLLHQDSMCLNIDNQSAIYLIKNENYHKRCKHIDEKYNFIKEKYLDKEIDLKYVCTREQYADILTKALPRDKFQYLRSKIKEKKIGIIKFKYLGVRT